MAARCRICLPPLPDDANCWCAFCSFEISAALEQQHVCDREKP